MTFNPGPFLRAIDRSEDLRSWLRARQAQLMERLYLYRRNMGDGCNFVRGCLQVLWATASQGQKAEFEQVLGKAGYAS